MLRRAVLLAGVLMLLGGVVLLGAWHTGPGAQLALFGAFLVIGIVAERVRYKPELTAPPGPAWRDTGERDVRHGHAVAVWFDPATGERAYVRAETPPGNAAPRRTGL